LGQEKRGNIFEEGAGRANQIDLPMPTCRM
jgi:hypothetical protein